MRAGDACEFRTARTATAIVGEFRLQICLDGQFVFAIRGARRVPQRRAVGTWKLQPSNSERDLPAPLCLPDTCNRQVADRYMVPPQPFAEAIPEGGELVLSDGRDLPSYAAFHQSNARTSMTKCMRLDKNDMQVLAATIGGKSIDPQKKFSCNLAGFLLDRRDFPV